MLNPHSANIRGFLCCLWQKQRHCSEPALGAFLKSNWVAGMKQESRVADLNCNRQHDIDDGRNNTREKIASKV